MARPRATLAKYGRFLTPILEVMIARSHGDARTTQLNTFLNSAFAELFALQQYGPKT